MACTFQNFMGCLRYFIATVKYVVCSCSESAGCNKKGHGQSMGLNFHNLSGLCSLTTLDISDCNISDGSILCNFGFLPSLVRLNLEGNDFSNIPAASISRLIRLEFLALGGCKRLESFPEPTANILEIYADECTSLKSIDQLTKYPRLHRVSLTKCHQLLKNKCHASMLDSLLKHMLKGLSITKCRFSIFLPGVSGLRTITRGLIQSQCPCPKNGRHPHSWVLLSVLFLIL
ncbi:uncharacterized protein LOC132637047 [Lycium barbarum]|uniref:uncharacterized protein LOC132637047 n=1 Tax=Lycium barbarum TaxID=112863 RepID=UPI00293E974C|nr:uncharacterized protein LOC132637047 [Lycium barbarum]